MSNSTPLPSLFGRFTAILNDHRHLGLTLGRMREMCAALEKGSESLAPELSPEQLFAELHSDLKEHFTAEEANEYFGTLAEEDPALAPQIAALKWEHLSMLALIEGLVDIAREHDDWPTLVVPARRLMAELERHERSESVLLRQFFLPRESP